MKMKKTIATVMAAMTAVSAMAATVSADQAEINLTYDLRTKVTTIDAGRGLYVQQFTAVQGSEAAQDMYTAYPVAVWMPGNKMVAALEFGGDDTYGFKDKVKEATFTFNLTKKKDGTDSVVNLSQTIKFTTDFEKVAADPTWIYVNDDDGKIDIDGDGIREFEVFSKDVAGRAIVRIPVSFGIAQDNEALSYLINPTVNYFNLGSYDLKEYGYTDMYIPVSDINDILKNLSSDNKDFGFNSVTANITYETEGFVNKQLINGWAFWDQHKTADGYNDVHKNNNYFAYNELAWLGIDYAEEAAVDSQYLTLGLEDIGTAIYQRGVPVHGIIGASVAKAGVKKEHIYPLLSTSSVYNYYSTTKGYVYVDGKLTPVYGTVDDDAIIDYKIYTVVTGENDDGTQKTEDIKVPVVGTISTVLTTPTTSKDQVMLTTNDVIGAIRRSGSGTSPLSVINDAIANDYDVEFTFTSASGYVGTKATNAVLQWVNFGEELTYPVINAWNKATFGQHLYSSKYNNVSSPYSGASFDPAYSLSANAATDMYGSFSSAWAQNLVSAGLVVNSELTMQLNDVQKLQWDQSKLTFHWDDVIDGKVTRVNQVLTTMLLYTPVDWFWDTLEVKVLKTEEVEDVTAGESLEEEGEDLEEEVVDEEEDFVDEEPEEDFEEEPEEDFDIPEEPEEPAEPEAPAEVVAPVAASPKTGNAPIALAVIPVALAAAAVVAKKRG